MTVRGNPDDNCGEIPLTEHTTAGVQIGCFHIQENGVIALHQAVGPQLFLVVQGESWVRGKDTKHVRIQAGQAVFWDSREWHETGSESGLMAIVVEGAELEPWRFMHAFEPVD